MKTVRRCMFMFGRWDIAWLSMIRYGAINICWNRHFDQCIKFVVAPSLSTFMDSRSHRYVHLLFVKTDPVSVIDTLRVFLPKCPLAKSRIQLLFVRTKSASNGCKRRLWKKETSTGIWFIRQYLATIRK